MNFAQASDLREKLTYMWTVCSSTEGHAEEHGAEHAEQAAAFQGFKPSVIRLVSECACACVCAVATVAFQVFKPYRDTFPAIRGQCRRLRLRTRAMC